MKTWTILGASLLASVVALSCSDSGGGNDGGGNDSGTPDSGDGDSGTKDSGKADTGTPDSGPKDSGPMGDAAFMLNGCGDGDFVDKSAPNDSRAITWDFNVSPKCILIAKGQTVTWNGTLTTHPLAPFNGDANNPIMTTSSGTTVNFTFANQGNYGFHCNVHASMQGVVRVKP
jgi:plastocyanin